MFKNILVVAAGGALGAVCRYLNARFFSYVFGATLPWATLFINVVGCFLMGLAYVWMIQKFQNSESMRLFVMMGFLGALTTWSTFSMESVLMLNAGETIKAFTYVLLTFILCFAAFFIGIKIST